MRRLPFLILIFLLLAPRAWAGTFYVRISGNDANAGTSAAAAFKTVNKAFSVAAAGDTVYIGAGSYSAAFTTPASGTSANRLAFIADTTGAKTGDAGSVTLTYWTTNVLSLSCSYVTFEGFVISGGQTTINYANSTGCILKACTLQSFSSGGIALANSSVTITNCTIQSGSGNGVTVGANSDLTITGGAIKSCTNGVAVTSASGSATIDGVLLTSCGGAGVLVSAGSAGVSNCVMSSLSTAATFSGSSGSIWNCTIVSNGNGIQCTSGTLTAKNNIITQVGTALSRTGSGVVVHGYNLYYNNGTMYSGVVAATGDKSGNPLFVSGSDYHLQSGSPARDAGTSASAAADMEANTRPCGSGWDIGAYEYGGCSTNTRRVVSWIEVEPS